MSSIAFPTAVPRTRTVNLGGDQFGRETFAAVLETQSLSDVRALLRGIAITETAAQIQAGNPPQLVAVDGVTSGKSVEDAQRKVEITFGTQLAQVAMRLVEIELRTAIERSTTAHSGKLADMTGAWQWRFIAKGGTARVVSSGSPLPAFGPGDKLVLVPAQVPYATITNRNVRRGGDLQARGRARKDKRYKGALARGFLATATAAVRRRAEFKGFSIVAEFTKAHMVPGEVMSARQGTGVITIRAHVRKLG
jgi:hypothetical protein